MALIVGAQSAALATASFTVDPELDEFPANTAGGSITATMKPGETCFAGKPYTFRKKAAANSYTIAFSNGETYEGASTIVLSDDNAVASIMWDALAGEWVRASAAGVGGNVPAGAVAKADTQCFGPFDLSLVAADADKIRFRPGFACTLGGVVGIQTKGTVATGTAIATLTTTAGSPTANTVTHNIADAANQVRTATPTGANCVVGATDFVDLAITGTNNGVGTRAAYTIQYTRT
jgi:hypothetical protein